MQVTSLTQALEALAEDERESRVAGLHYLLDQDSAAMADVLARYPALSRARGRDAALFFLMRFARSHPSVVALGVSALSDPAARVRRRACGLLAYAQKSNVVPSLKRLGSDEPFAKAAIAAITTRDLSAFTARSGTAFWYAEPRELGRGPWPNFADDFTEACGSTLAQLGFRRERGFTHDVVFAGKRGRVAARWDSYDLETLCTLNDFSVDSLARAADLPMLPKVNARAALGDFARALSSSLAVLLPHEPRLRRKAGAVSKTLSGGAPKLPGLLALLEAPELHASAAHAIGLLGKRGAAAAPRLAADLDDAVSDVRIASAGALEAIGVDETAGRWLTALADPDVMVRGSAARALACLRSNTRRASAALNRALARPQPLWLRIEIAKALLAVAPSRRGAAVATLLKAIRGRAILERAKAARALGRVQSPGRSVIGALTRALADREPLVRMDAAAALVELKAPAPVVVPALLVLVAQGQGLRFRIEAATLLGDIGSSAKAALPTLRALNADDAKLAAAIDRAVRKIDRAGGIRRERANVRKR